jgi:hypothetical protein
MAQDSKVTCHHHTRTVHWPCTRPYQILKLRSTIPTMVGECLSTGFIARFCGVTVAWIHDLWPSIIMQTHFIKDEHFCFLLKVILQLFIKLHSFLIWSTDQLLRKTSSALSKISLCIAAILPSSLACLHLHSRSWQWFTLGQRLPRNLSSAHCSMLCAVSNQRCPLMYNCSVYAWTKLTSSSFNSIDNFSLILHNNKCKKILFLVSYEPTQLTSEARTLPLGHWDLYAQRVILIAYNQCQCFCCCHITASCKQPLYHRLSVGMLSPEVWAIVAELQAAFISLPLQWVCCHLRCELSWLYSDWPSVPRSRRQTIWKNFKFQRPPKVTFRLISIIIHSPPGQCLKHHRLEGHHAKYQSLGRVHPVSTEP